MTATTPLTTDEVDYLTLLEQLRITFAAAVANPATPLFTTNADNLFSLFLEYLPEAMHQHHTCNACHKFLERFGGLVAVNDKGVPIPVMWTMVNAPALYADAVREMYTAVLNATITGVFYESEATWGLPSNVGADGRSWVHMAVSAPDSRRWTNRAKTAHQAMAEKAQDHATLARALAEFTLPQLEIAKMITSEDSDLYRSEAVRGVAEWLYSLKQRLNGVRSHARKANLLWLAVATAPAGFCHPKSSMIGTILDDISAGLKYADIKARFEAKMQPEQYRRAQVAPSAGTIKQAERLFEQLGLAPSLQRRYARFDEIPISGMLWMSRPTKQAQAESGGLFGHITPKQSTPALTVDIARSAITITWEKFQRVVLPNAQQMDVLIPHSANHFAALVTAADPAAPPILKWDAPSARNPFSWYYAAGVDAEMRRRVLAAGGKVEGVDIRATLMWNNRNDLDLHAVPPSGNVIYWSNKQETYGHGWLDVDKNVRGETMEPVENIRWDRGRAANGRYAFYVNIFATHGGYGIRTPFKVEIEVEGAVSAFEGETSELARGQVAAGMVKIAEFFYERGKPVEITSRGTSLAVATSPNVWGVTPGTYVTVTAITRSPNLWGKQAVAHEKQHAFFLLEGCRDTQNGVGRGFYNEMLIGDLHGVRSVMEAYTASAPIVGADEATACGIGISNDGTDNLIVRVNGTTLYTIDRWD